MSLESRLQRLEAAAALAWDPDDDDPHEELIAMMDKLAEEHRRSGAPSPGPGAVAGAWREVEAILAGFADD